MPEKPMRVLIHDFCGHPFSLGLAVKLAQRGNDVHYVYFASESGPKGDFAAAAAEAPTLHLHGLLPDIPYRKDAWLQRRRDDLQYARLLRKQIEQVAPSVVLSGNCPTEVQSFVVAGCRSAGSGFVYWMQDFYSIAATKILSRKIGAIGKAIGLYWRVLDARHLRASDSIILITEDFRPLAQSMAGRKHNIEVIENWGTLKDIDTNADGVGWLGDTGIAPDGRTHFLYSGTLGLKHNPELLVQLAARNRERITVTVVSNGASVPFLQQRLAELGLENNLKVMGLRPFKELSAMLASADVLVAMIEPDAGTFSVPSKVLSYLCAGRPVLLAAPTDNLASRIVNRIEAGQVVPPDDIAGFLAAAERLLESETRHKLGANGRRYAEETFDITAICARFETILAAAQRSGKGGAA